MIPVYNEAGRLGDCLRAIAAQNMQPYEVIVVDNNSTDGTAAVAASFPFVTLLAEPRQGVVHARNTGFDAARGEIIGRIDADTLLEPDWVQRVGALFAAAPIDAFSGGIDYRDIACSRLVTRVDQLLRAWLARRMVGATFLLGANMAIRRSAWQSVRAQTCAHGQLHEDLDLSAHLAKQRKRVEFSPQIIVGVSGRRADTGPIDFATYLRLSPQTYARHGLRQHIYMYPVVAFVYLNYGFLRAVYRGYNPEAGKFHWRKIFASQSERRTNPAL